MVAFSVVLFPPLLIAFLLVMERVEEPLRRPGSARDMDEFLSTTTPDDVDEFLSTATPDDVDELAHSGIRRALTRWRGRRGRGRTANPPLV
ncbi:hypothetical protein OF117_16920 [Geodermatophilus sp. YIM 151500]|uniref:hypothetical protein n=1 Tax=Geodermatophilus sp. YIM 151500 TaxID=2984531 RepID=UPI0021E4D326|nr:hypothetical protein [Geodermatophilus sp. YIM 151500]MCV2491039.1 hypothetical protein [Geodermatophilus sp. YIM 151500]